MFNWRLKGAKERIWKACRYRFAARDIQLILLKLAAAWRTNRTFSPEICDDVRA